MTLERDFEHQREPVVLRASHAAFTPTAAVASELALDGVGLTDNCDTVIEAAVPGVAGDDITIAFVEDAGAAATGVLDESDFPAIVFTFRGGVTTVANFETKVGLSENLAVKTAGTGATVLVADDDEFPAENLAGGTDASDPTVIAMWKAPASGGFRLDRVCYVSDAGLAAHASNFVTLELLSGSTPIASWSTETGAEGTIGAGAPVVFAATEGDAIVAAGAVLSLRLLPGDGEPEFAGTVTLPLGRVYAEGRFV